MIPLWAISAIGAGAVAGMAGFGLASKLADAKMARAEAGWAQERTTAAEATARASETARATEAAWAASAARIQTEGEQRHAQITADAERARRAAGSLRDALDIAARALASGGPGAATAPAECAPAIEAARVRSDMLAGLADRGAAVAEFADRAYAAGAACVAADAVMR